MEEPRYTDDEALPGLVQTLAALGREGAYWDFKREWHENNAALLHDIICMANNPAGTTGLLIIGVDEEAGFAPTGSAEQLGKRRDTQNLTDVLRSKHWADGMPSVRVVPVEEGPGLVDVVLVDHDDEAVPYYLVEDFREGKATVRAGVVYSRDADSNTPLTRSASPLAVERLWRRHFGLDKAPLERLPQLLKEPAKWDRTLPVLSRDEENCGYCYCHVEHPEFTYVRRPEEDWNKIELFMLASPFFDGPDWWTGYFYYHQTMIARISGAYSDHLWIPEPQIAALRKDKVACLPDDAHYYTYYYEGSLERIAMLFELDESKEGPSASEEIRWLDSLIPVYKDESERNRFESWVLENWEMFLAHCEEQSITRRVPGKPERTAGQYSSIERRSKESATLVDLLHVYRGLEMTATSGCC